MMWCAFCKKPVERVRTYCSDKCKRRAWVARMTAEGLCVSCGRPKSQNSKSRCFDCVLKIRLRMRRYQAFKNAVKADGKVTGVIK